MEQVYLVNSFVKNDAGGNPAGVCLNADHLSEQKMQYIAQKVHVSETAFVQKSLKADFRVRFFSPELEVPLCGHATIATFYLLAKKGVISKGRYTQETNAGILDIEVLDDGIIFMYQNLPRFSKIEASDVLDCLNLSEDQLIPDLPIEVVSTGFPSIMVPIKSLKTVKELQVNLEKSIRVSHKELLIHAFTLETINNGSTAFSRNFFPVISVLEDPATGSASGALACYLHKHGILQKDKTREFIFEQGYFMGKQSEIRVALKTDGAAINEVRVGGRAILQGTVSVDRI